MAISWHVLGLGGRWMLMCLRRANRVSPSQQSGDHLFWLSNEGAQICYVSVREHVRVRLLPGVTYDCGNETEVWAFKATVKK